MKEALYLTMAVVYFCIHRGAVRRGERGATMYCFLAACCVSLSVTMFFIG